MDGGLADMLTRYWKGSPTAERNCEVAGVRPGIDGTCRGSTAKHLLTGGEGLSDGATLKQTERPRRSDIAQITRGGKPPGSTRGQGAHGNAALDAQRRAERRRFATPAVRVAQRRGRRSNRHGAVYVERYPPTGEAQAGR